MQPGENRDAHRESGGVVGTHVESGCLDFIGVGVGARYGRGEAPFLQGDLFAVQFRLGFHLPVFEVVLDVERLGVELGGDVLVQEFLQSVGQGDDGARRHA